MRLLLIVLITGGLAACQPSLLTDKQMRAILHERNEKLGQLFKEGDATALSLMYTDSAKLCPDGADIYVGRDAIRKFWAEANAGSQLLEMATQTITVDGTADVIYETGKTVTKSLYKDSVYTFRVKFANVWRKQPNGEYLLDVDIWNNLPEAH